MSELKNVEFTTSNGGVKPAVRTAIKEQFMKQYGISMDSLENLGNGQYGVPVAIDQTSGETVYAMLKCTVGFAPKPRAKKEKHSEPVTVPNLFEQCKGVIPLTYLA